MKSDTQQEIQKPFDAQFYISPLWYKIGLQQRVFIWTEQDWIRSTMSAAHLEAEIIMQTIKPKRPTEMDGMRFLRRMNEILSVNERDAIVLRFVYNKSCQDIAKLIMVCPGRVNKIITTASDKLNQ